MRKTGVSAQIRLLNGLTARSSGNLADLEHNVSTAETYTKPRQNIIPPWSYKAAIGYLVAGCFVATILFPLALPVNQFAASMASTQARKEAVKRFGPAGAIRESQTVAPKACAVAGEEFRVRIR